MLLFEKFARVLKLEMPARATMLAMPAKITFCSIIFILSFKPLLAENNYPPSFGLSISTKMGINAAAVPKGIQNAPAILKGVDFAGMGYLPLSSKSRIGFMLEFGSTNSPFELTSNNISHITGSLFNPDTSYISEKFYFSQRAFTISPLFVLSGFVVGVDIGFPGAVKHPDVTIKNININDISRINEVARLVPMSNDVDVSFRMGCIIPVFTSSAGTLNFIANLTYQITGIDYMYNYETVISPSLTVTQKKISSYTYNPLTVGVGVNYLFNLNNLFNKTGEISE